jgi:hypothetical protein
MSDYEIKLKCIEIASQHRKDATPDELLELARKLFSWVFRPAVADS